MAKKKKDIYFVNIPDPVNLRRELLTAIKSLLVLLKDYHNLVQVRNEKLAKVKQLEQTFDEINSLYEQFSSHLPDVPKKHITVEKPSIPEKVEKISVPKKKSSELDELEQELLKVEEELKNLK